MNLDNLDEFGHVVEGQENVNPFCVYDPTNDEADPDGFVCGVDGYVVDNCNVDIDVMMYLQISTIAVQVISYRTFTASDANGSVQCFQTITIENFDPITTDAIIWPLDYHGVE